ncbi:RskA family anti-sigma factor [Jiangella alkaliphila]|uniref:Anti-sigma-K factor RskA N-terminal domain-containing protein n=1 Tax=Jiangella alkaliphila TaxID=419479 RepID=A0A1H2LG27_9ACTN|nr:hypothetical protein [Jiangella alkaliphila]SDU79578.1 hypothetical protein SAMN04488563_6027 [Jiangella alkaliphila]
MRRRTPNLHTLAAAYALHAVPPDEVAPFEDHLGVCTSCRSEVIELREAAVRLGATVAIAPPRRLKSRLLREIAEVRRLPPLPAPESIRRPRWTVAQSGPVVQSTRRWRSLVPYRRK